MPRRSAPRPWRPSAMRPPRCPRQRPVIIAEVRAARHCRARRSPRCAGPVDRRRQGSARRGTRSRRARGCIIPPRDVLAEADHVLGTQLSPTHHRPGTRGPRCLADRERPRPTSISTCARSRRAASRAMVDAPSSPTLPKRAPPCWTLSAATAPPPRARRFDPPTAVQPPSGPSPPPRLRATRRPRSHRRSCGTLTRQTAAARRCCTRSRRCARRCPTTRHS